ncbi:uncharacterized protein KQ657_001605 [Scheffersomyces spartinae]|uniref:P-loop containing nucleoside triphosphate hydrolase protein n=1 Tax=Scheffersomyces spartinae TaxID=45513 RepID=A0A9P7V787_9ASCO|nr:uncharacterized protein KQ657_001605 [Scheffersomyces spartinae]KAG7192510.1 hypothetical protein KQ657_001605 [Scheffersomyces spartinae]
MDKLPPEFKRLFRLFYILNTRLTFLLTHSSSTIPSYDVIAKFYLPQDDLHPVDLAIIKALLPEGDVFYDYVDENQLHLLFVEKVDFNWKTGYHQHKESESIDDLKNGGGNNSDQILIFDFRDARINSIASTMFKRRKPNNVGRGDDLFFLLLKELKLQNLTTKQIQGIIASRNDKFLKCINTWLDQYSDDEVANNIPMDKLKTLAVLPVPQVFVDPIENLVTSTSSSSSSSSSTDAKQYPTIDMMLKALHQKPFYKDQIVTTKVLNPPRAAKTNTINLEFIHPDLQLGLDSLKKIDLEKDLYTHQAQAIDALISENLKHVIVTTSTSSGKSLIYQIPVLNDILWDIDSGLKGRHSTALFIFPTKALAQDQKRHLQDLIDKLPLNNKRKIIIDTYDGDTPSSLRRGIRSHADILFTNPDSIHASILAHHDTLDDHSSWEHFLKSLKYVIMDELHVYKGTFGVHVGLVMSRLRRICDSLGNVDIQCISCSATINDSVEHFKTVCGIPPTEAVVHIFEDGSPCSERRLVIWRPPPLMNKLGKTAATEQSATTSTNNYTASPFIPRESATTELAKILLQLLTNVPNIKVIVFCTIRKICELLMKEVKSLLKEQNKFGPIKVDNNDIMAYRGGYSKSDRRIIERKMFNGDLKAIIATNALELGIDLADLDVVITSQFPFLKLNLHQQFGRAGRAKDSKGSLAIFVGGSNATDQHYMTNPDELVDRSTYEDLCVTSLINGGSTDSIMEAHLQCAAYEIPLNIMEDMKYFVRETSDHDDLIKENNYSQIVLKNLIKDNKGYYRTLPKYLPDPHTKVTIRAVEEDTYAVVDLTNNRNIVIEEIEASRTSFSIYKGAIFLHQGLPYLVEEFNAEGKYAKVKRVDVDWITQQRDFTDVDPQETQLIKPLHPIDLPLPSDIPAYFGLVRSRTIVFGYFKVNRRGEILEAEEVNNPPFIVDSKGFWLDIPSSALDAITKKSLSPAGGIHAAQHALMNMLPIFVSGGATTNPNAKFSGATSSVGEAELITECKAPEKEFAKRQTTRIRPARLIFYDAKGGIDGSGISANVFKQIDHILYATYNRVVDCECVWGCPLCVCASFCKESNAVMSKPAAIIILAAFLGLDILLVAEGLPDGPEENMPSIEVETVAPVAAPIKFATDVQIVQTRRIPNEVQIKQEDEKEDDNEVKQEEEDVELDTSIIKKETI